MTTLTEQLQYISRGSMVRRFHQHHQLVQDTDGRHSHGVAMIAALLSNGEPSAALLIAALTHDLPELVSGDVPATTKRVMRSGSFDLDAYETSINKHYGFPGELTDKELRTLKLADGLDGMLQCTREVAVGNRTVVWVYEKWLSWLQADFGELTAAEQAMLSAIEIIWKNVRNSYNAGYTEPLGAAECRVTPK